MADSLFPPSLIEEPSFREHLRQLLSFDAGTIIKLRSHLPENPAQLTDYQYVQAQASIVGISPDDYRRVAPIGRMLISTVAAEKAGAKEVVEFSAEIAGIELEDDAFERLIKFVSPTEDEAKRDNEVRAFSFGITYAGASFQPIAVPFTSGGRVGYLYGGSLIVDYFDGSPQKRSLAINISRPELGALIRDLQDAFDSLEQLEMRGRES